MKKEKVFGIDVCVTNYEELCKNLNKDIINNEKKFIVAVNPEKLMKAKKDDNTKKILQEADYQIPDGVGIIYASKLNKGKIKTRITGIDLMDKICSLANDNKYKVFMYGASKDVITTAKIKLEEKYHQIKITGYCDGYEKNNDIIVDKINKSKAEIVFVALGSPKQENWIKDNMTKCNACIYQGVGGSFDVISGKLKRAPIKMQKLGLEWLYRLIKEPKRIFRQIKIISFLFKVMIEKSKKEKINEK